MLRKNLIKIFIFFCVFMGALVFFSDGVHAKGYPYCQNKIEGSEYYNCGNYVYTYPEDTLHSSILFADDKKGNILYGGEDEQGRLLFYADGLRYFNFSYDDRSDADNNLWTVITSKGSNVYNGSFKDVWYLDDGHKGDYPHRLGSEVYVVKQYEQDGELVRTMLFLRMHDNSVEFINPMYDGKSIVFNDTNEILESKEGIRMNIEAKLGLQEVDVRINSELVQFSFVNGELFISSDELNSRLTKGEETHVEITTVNVFGKEYRKEFDLLIVEDEATIEFETMNSVMESASRRIVITATAGKGKELDRDYCWYYWSKNPNDNLTYDDFLVNYAASEHKGSYSGDKGVILRNTTGTYYLYALAKDEDSWTVKRSEGYVLNSNKNIANHSINDAIFIVSLMLIATLPILIYIFVKKRGY